MAHSTAAQPKATAANAQFPTWDRLQASYTNKRDNTLQSTLLEAVAAMATMTNLDLNLGDVYSEYPELSERRNLWLFTLLNQAQSQSDRLSLIRFLTEAF